MAAQQFDLTGLYGIDQEADWNQTLYLKDNSWVVTIFGSPASGTWKFQWGSSPPLTTIAIAYNATAAVVQTAIQTLGGIGSAVSVTGPAGGPWVVTGTAELIALLGGLAPTVDGTALLGAGGSVVVTAHPWDLTGYTAKMQIKAAAGGSVLATLATGGAGIVLGGTAGTVALTIPHATTTSLAFATAQYDLYLTDGSGNVTGVIFGTISNRLAVTTLP